LYYDRLLKLAEEEMHADDGHTSAQENQAVVAAASGKMTRTCG